MNEGQVLRRVLYSLGSLTLGVILIVLLRRVYSFDVSELAARSAQINPTWAGLFFLSTAFNFYITALKWRTVTEAVTGGDSLSGKYFFYTSLSILVSQFLPPQVAMISVRSLAMRFHERINLLKGVASTVFDHMYDLMITLSLLLPALLVLTQLIEPTSGLILCVLMLAIAAVLAISCGRYIVPFIIQITRHVPILGSTFSRLPESQEQLRENILLQPRFAARLFLLSLIRYGNLMLRAYVVALAVGLDIPFWKILLAIPVVQLTVIISVTPASIGISEWGLVGVLCGFGVDSADAVLYALFRRILVVAAVLAINAVLLLNLAFRRVGRYLMGRSPDPNLD